MKKLFFITIFFLLAPLFLIAQTNTFPASGDVGIGTTNPSAKLHIKTNRDGLLTFQTSDNTWLYTNWLDNTGTRRLWMGLGSDLSSFNINVENGTNKILLNGGNVGIGTTSPKEKLQIGNAFTFHDGGHDVIGFNYAASGGLDLDNSKYSAEIRFDPVNGYLGLGTSSSVTNNPTSSLFINKNGYVGIGTSSPNEKLTVKGHVNIGGDGNYRLRTRHIDGKSHVSTDVSDLFLNYGIDKNVYVGSFYSGSPDSDLFVSGNIGIGTTTPDSKLTVKGNIHTNEVKVDLLGAIAPDYVFYKDYDLKTLQEVENYISLKGHLPNIPSAKQMEAEGIKLKEMNLKLLEKIEELTLYTINQEKRIETIEKENTELKTQEKRIALLEEKITLLLNKK